MRVLIAGASGFLGRAVSRAFAEQGHEVHGLARSPQAATAVRDSGATPVHGDVLDAKAVAEAVRGCDLVVHLAQDTSGNAAMAREVRVQGAKNLVAAAVATGVSKLVVGSGYWVYADNPGTLVEASPLRPMAISQLNFDAEQVARASADAGAVEVTVVRPGMVYGAGSWFGEMVRELRSGAYRYVGTGENYLSPVELTDAARAFCAVSERWTSGGLYLIVDDRPVTHHEFATFVAERLGAPAPRGLPFTEAEKEWGREIALLNAASRRASNAALRRSGWTPRFPSYREGIPRILERMAAR